MGLILTNGHKGLCLIAMGIVMRDTNCSSEEVLTNHKDRYTKLILKKGKNYGVNEEDAAALATLSIGELVS